MFEYLHRFLRPFRLKTVIGLLTKVVEVLFELATPLIVARMIDVGVKSHDVSSVFAYGGLLLGLACVGFCSTLVCQKMAALVAQGMGTNTRDALFSHIGRLSTADVDLFGTPSLVTRTTNDVNQVQLSVALSIRQLTRWPFLAVGSVVATFCTDVHLGLIFLVCVPAVALVFWLVMSRSVPYFRVMQGKLDKVGLVVREGLSGVRVIRAFRREGHEDRRFRAASGELTHTAVRVGRLSATLAPVTFLIMNLGVVAILWLGAVRIDAGALTQGQIIAFVGYMSQTLVSIVAMANFVVVINRGAASAQRIMDVLNVEPSIVDGSDVALSLDESAPVLELRGASFAFGGAGHEVVSNVSLSLRRGEVLGIIGGTGSGKSSLVNLLPRLYDVSAGEVCVMGHDVRAYPLGQLRSLVSLVPQKATLMSGTIRSNLTWRDEGASDADLWAALEVAQAASFVRQKPLALDEPVEADGKNFSGGQRQRLTIARALVGHPALVALDDSASALDFKTDAALRLALGRLSHETTTVIVSQRVSSVMNADHILVLDHGHVAGLGTHHQLLETCQLYREICLSQLSPEEVA